jgi:hypothetical protein
MLLVLLVALGFLAAVAALRLYDFATTQVRTRRWLQYLADSTASVGELTVADGPEAR